MRLYHYTTGFSLACILQRRTLKPSTSIIGEKPVLWFTESPAWEPTTADALEAQLGVDWGRWRVVVERKWVPLTFQHFAARYSGLAQILESTAIARGSSPWLWRYRLTPLPANRWLAVERDDGGVWVPVRAEWVMNLLHKKTAPVLPVA